MSLSCVQQRSDGDERVIVFSGFIADIQGEWVYVTAGHILRRLKTAMDAGAKFGTWRLGDDTAGGQFQGIAIPFHFDPDEWMVIEDEDLGIDYAAVVLRTLYRAALDAGGARPLPYEAWGSNLSEHNFWALMGVPSESVKYDGQSIIAAKTVTLVLEPTDSPAGPSEKDEYRFYGKLVGDSLKAVGSVDGMSGGPIFALRAIEGVWHYSVIGVQSGWFPGDRILIACPFDAFAAVIVAAIQPAQESQC